MLPRLLFLVVAASGDMCLLQARSFLSSHPDHIPVKVDEEGVMHPLPLDYEERKREGVLVPFEEVDDTCEYATEEKIQCVDYTPTLSMRHMKIRRVVMMFLIFGVGLWSYFNELFVRIVTSVVRKEMGEQALEVVHALFAEVTVLGFIALLTGVLIRSGRLHAVSVAIFGDHSEHGPHREHMAGESYNPYEIANITQIMPGHYRVLSGEDDLRDGRELSELTVLFEDVHIVLFFVMLAFIAVAALNLHQVKQITAEWDHAEELVTKHGEQSAFQILSAMAASPHTGWFRRKRLLRHLSYLSYRHEFLYPAYGQPVDGVDPETFPFAEYLQYCAGMAVVENVEVPVWMYIANSFFVLGLRPFFSLTASLHIVLFFLACPYMLAVYFGFMLYDTKRIEARVAVDMIAKGNDTPRRAGDDMAPLLDAQLGRGRKFALAEKLEPAKVRKADGFGGLRSALNGTLTPTPFERLFWFQRNGPRVLAMTSRMLLFWVAVYVAVLCENFRVMPYTWSTNSWALPLIAIPILYILFELYPQVTFLRILVTTTEYSPNRTAIHHIQKAQAEHIQKVKLALVSVLRRERMRGMLRDAAAHGTRKLEKAFDGLPARTRHFVDKAYFAFDTDNNGFLDAKELMRCLDALKLSGDELDLGEQEKDESSLERPKAQEWFQILAPDARGLSHRQFKVLIWALASLNEMELEESQVLEYLERMHPGQKKVSADALARISLALTNIPKTSCVLGKSLLREAFLLRHDSYEMPAGYEAPLEDVAGLIVALDHELSTQRGLD